MMNNYNIPPLPVLHVPTVAEHYAAMDEYRRQVIKATTCPDHCKELAKLALDFFIQHNPHLNYTTQAVELLESERVPNPRGNRYTLKFTTKPHHPPDNPPPLFQCSDQNQINSPVSQTTFEADVYCECVPDPNKKVVEFVAIRDQ